MTDNFVVTIPEAHKLIEFNMAVASRTEDMDEKRLLLNRVKEIARHILDRAGDDI